VRGADLAPRDALHGKWLKESLDLRNWESAQKLVRDWESAHAEGSDQSTVPHVCAAFMWDCEARHVSTASLGKYRLLTSELTEDFKGRSCASLIRSLAADSDASSSVAWIELQSVSPETSLTCPEDVNRPI